MQNNNLRELREKKGRTQAEVAEEAKISLRAYQYIELEGRIPNARTAILIAQILHSSVENLFGAATPNYETKPDGNPDST